MRPLPPKSYKQSISAWVAVPKTFLFSEIPQSGEQNGTQALEIGS
ncbi:MAG: hypothetical protein ACI8S3_001831, partial [Alphaproteobacteria bacterium]